MTLHSRYKKMLLLFLVMLMPLSACTPISQDISTLDERSYRNQQKLEELTVRLDGGVDPQKADTWSQVQSMRQELAALRADVDAMGGQSQRVQIDNLSQQIEAMQIAWQQLNAQLGTTIDLAAIAARRGPQRGVQSAHQAAGAVISPDTAARQSNTARSAGSGDTAQELYNNARAAFEARKYERGQVLWDELVIAFPRHSLVPNALFWQGECYYQLKDYARAVLKYQTVLDQYKKSTKYHTAMFKQGLAFMRLGRVKAGKLLLADVVEKFPDTPEGKRSRTILAKN